MIARVGNPFRDDVDWLVEDTKVVLLAFEEDADDSELMVGTTGPCPVTTGVSAADVIELPEDEEVPGPEDIIAPEPLDDGILEA